MRSALEPLARRQVVELARGGEQRAHIQVTATLETLMGLVGAPAADVAQTLPVSSTSVERLTCDSTINRVLLDAKSLVIDVGQTERVLKGAKRRALIARDSACRWPGCDRPSSRSAAHHIVHWTRGGATDLDNLILLCHRHHTLVHEGGWQVVKVDDGGIRTIPPPTPRFEFWSRAPD